MPMKRTFFFNSLVAAAAAIAFLAPRPTLADSPPDTPERCIRVHPEARYRGLGYNHIVHVADVCATPAECDVSTDVNPQPQHVSVAGNGEVEVATFIGSPARVFVPKVDCTMPKH